MKPVRKNIPTQIVTYIAASRKACASPEAVIWTAPICDIPRFSIRSPALAHTTIAKTMTSVLIRSLLSLAISRGLVVSGSRRRPRHGNHGLVVIAALACSLQALRAQRQEFPCFVVQALPFVAVPERLLHDAPGDPGPEVILIIETVHAPHHFHLRQVRVFDVRQLMPPGISQGFDFQEALRRLGVVKFCSRIGLG